MATTAISNDVSTVNAAASDSKSKSGSGLAVDSDTF
jgi:hypothetical protein